MKRLRKIYCYTTRTFGSPRTVRDDADSAWAKVGETVEQEIVERINQQDGTAVPEKLLRVKNSSGKELAFETYLTDGEIRSELEKLGYYQVRQDKHREWMGGFEDLFLNGDELEFAINKIIKDSKEDTRKIYDPYFYKVYIEELFFQMLDSALKTKEQVDFAMELAPRFGKTTLMITMLIRLYKERGYKICVLPSYWLSSLSSFEKDLMKYRGFSEYIEFVDRNSDIDDAIDKFYGKKLIVVEASLFLEDEDWDKRFETIKNLPRNEKCIMIDEADFGAWKTKSQRKINFIDSELNIYLSGTGIDKVAYNLKNLDNNIIQFSYTDMLLVKTGKHPLFFQ